MSELSPLSRQIWDMKYCLKDDESRPLEADIDATWRRVAKALAAVERDPGAWEDCFYEALRDFAFLPAGRILSGAGVNRRVTLFNCFVMGRIPDDMSGIFQHLKEASLTLQAGGGIGYDFSTLRPKGAVVRGVGADASGPLSFMDVWDAMCQTIMSAGSRRGAMMATLRCDHPDIEDFVSAKQRAGRLTNFNLSVLVTDAFVQAIRDDADWPLVFEGETYRTLKAKDLWDAIMQATYEASEPGVIFIDRINARNNLAYCETIHATNPCGEQPLPPYGACLLGSINLFKLVQAPFTPDAKLDIAGLETLVQVAVRMLDNAIDASRFPLEAQEIEAEDKRRIGLGVTGLADALIACGLTYGSDKAVAEVRRWMKAFRDSAYEASSDLAAEKGPFPLYDEKAFLAAHDVATLEKPLREKIARQGMRNGLVTSIAPTGTISLLASNLSSGLEPVFAFEYTRNLLRHDGSREKISVSDPALALFRQLHGEQAALPEAFVDTQVLRPEDHLAMQAAVQDYIDSSVSKTINLPSEISFQAFQDVYLKAYELGCKGCTTYRPSAIRGSVLETTSQLPAQVDTAGPVVQLTEPLDRPETLPGRTYKLRWPGSDHAIYITMNDIVQETPAGPRIRPFEIFINSKNMEHYAWTVALTRMISAVFRRGGDVAFVVEELKAVFDPRGGAWMGGAYVPSLLAAIGDVIERHMREIGFLPSPREDESLPQALIQQQDGGAAGTDGGPSGAAMSPPSQCARCGAAAVIHQEGCDLCTNCGYSRCS